MLPVRRLIGRPSGPIYPAVGTARHNALVASERNTQASGRQLEWAARRAAGGALKPDDVIVDIEVGKLKRYRDNGVDKPIVTPKLWARAIPIARGLMNIAYTREQVLFLSDGLALNCHIVWVHRAELDHDNRQVFAFARRDRPLSILAIEPIGVRDSKQPSAFLDHLLAVRDQERTRLPAAARERLEDLDRALRSRSIDELWDLPAHHLELWNTVPANSTDTDSLDSFEPEQAFSEQRWRILCDATAAAHAGDAAAFAAALMRLETEVPADGHAGAYVWYMLCYAVTDYLERRPELEDLQEIARYRHREFGRVVRLDARALEDVLRTAFGMAAADRQVTGGSFAVLGVAALGVMLKDPLTQLAAIKPHLADWWQPNGQDMVRAGKAPPRGV